MNRITYILLGLLPSFLWLLFYFKKDEDPEPKKKILELFLLGAVGALFAAIIETFLLRWVNPLEIQEVPKFMLLFFGVAVIEEVLKFLPVQLRGIRNFNMDEPVDLMVYMVSSAMGFASAENIALFFTRKLKFLEVFAYSGLRFLGATLLHALCSGIIGYFLALSFYEKRKKVSYLFSGFSLAIVLHTLYNFSIIRMKKFSHFTFPALLLAFMFFAVLYFFQKAKGLDSLCKD